MSFIMEDLASLEAVRNLFSYAKVYLAKNHEVIANDVHISEIVKYYMHLLADIVPRESKFEAITAPTFEDVLEKFAVLFKEDTSFCPYGDIDPVYGWLFPDVPRHDCPFYPQCYKRDTLAD